MKQKRGRIIRRLAACLLAAALAGMAGTQNPAAGEKAEPAVPVLELPEAEQGRVEEIPVEQDSLQNSLPPLESCYLYGGEDENPTGYADPSITVNLGTGTIYGTKYLYARIKIASASQLRTLLASPVGKQGTSPGHNLAKRVQAVIAINGDFNYAPSREDEGFDSGDNGVLPDGYTNVAVYPLRLLSPGISTAVDAVTATKTVAGTHYYNLQGAESSGPHKGFNLVVTTYTDGSISTAKMMK